MPRSKSAAMRRALAARAASTNIATGRSEMRAARLRARGKPLKLPYQSASRARRSEEHTSELQSLMRISYAVFCLKKKKTKNHIQPYRSSTRHIAVHSHLTNQY